MAHQGDMRRGAAARSASTSRLDRRALRKRRGLETKLADIDRLVAKRSSQLSAAAERRAGLAARLADLPVAAAERDLAYCLKDRLRVTLREPRPMVLTNGRLAVAGLCPICGSRVVSFG